MNEARAKTKENSRERTANRGNVANDRTHGKTANSVFNEFDNVNARPGRIEAKVDKTKQEVIEVKSIVSDMREEMDRGFNQLTQSILELRDEIRGDEK